MTLCDWASQLIKHPEFHLSNDWLTFLLGIQIMRGGDSSQIFEEYSNSPSIML